MKKGLNSFTSKGYVIASIIASIVTPMTVAAQNSNTSLTLEEITVTAQKREQSLQSTPIAISALTSEALEAKGITDFYNLTNQVPTLTLSNNGGVPLVNLRGTGNEINSLGADSGVGLHLDGVFLAQPAGFAATLYDVERVEVLRGPQGTLFGRNTTGGSINVISASSTDEFEAFGDVTFGNYNKTRVRGVVNLPLSDTVGLRIAATKDDRDGFARNINPSVNDELDDEDSYFIRATLDWEISDAASLSLKVISNEREDSGVFLKGEASGVPGADSGTGFLSPPPFSAIVLGVGGFGVDPFDPAVGFIAPSTGQVIQPNPTDPRVTRSEIQGERSRYETNGITADLEWDLGSVTFKSLTSFYEVENGFRQDFDDSELPIFGVTEGLSNTETFSQEFQLSSNAWNSVEWVVGLYYFDNEGTRETAIIDSIFDALGGTPDVLDAGGFVADGSIDVLAYSAFGQATWSVNDKLNLTAGLRVSRDEKEAFDLLFAFAPNLTGVFQQVDVGASVESTEPSGRVTLDYQLNDDSLVYLTYGRGFRSGAINLLAPLDPAVDPEFADSYEFGSKNRFFNDRLQLNIAVHYTEYSDQQFTQFGSAGTQFIVSSGESTAFGIEADFDALITDKLSIDGSFGWIEAEFDNFETAFGANAGALLQQDPFAQTNLEGNQIPRTPETSFSLGVQYAQPLQLGASLTFRTDFAYRSEIFYDVFNIEAAREPSFTKTNFRIRYASANEKWTVEAFVDNIEDDDVRNNVIIQNPSANLAVFNPPRTYGLTVGYRY